MRWMGLDVGDKTIGVALSDLMGWTAQGLTTLKRVSVKSDIEQLIQWILEYDVEKLIVGLPKNMNGTIGPQAEKTLAFVKQVEKKFKYSDKMANHPVEIVMWDERLTTAFAERLLIEADVRREKRKSVIDKVAAVAILQGYLDYTKNNEERMKNNGDR